MTEPGDVAHSQQADSGEAESEVCVCRLNLFACPVHPRTFEPKQVGSWWEAPINPPIPFEPGDPAVTPEQVVALLAPQKPGRQPHVGVWETEPGGEFRVDFRATDLHWGETVGTDATRTGREIGIPVCDDDGRELGEMRMGYANARVLAAMLADAAVAPDLGAGWINLGAADTPSFVDLLKADVIALSQEEPDGKGIAPTMARYMPQDAAPFDALANLTAGAAYIAKAYADRTPTAYLRGMSIARDGTDDDRLDEFRVALTRGERWPLDHMTDPMVDVLYAEIDMLRARHTPDVQQRQEAALAKQVKEIGDLPGQIAYRIRAELVCCDAYDVHGRLDASDEIEPPHAICYWGEAAARIAEGRSDDDTPEQP